MNELKVGNQVVVAQTANLRLYPSRTSDRVELLMIGRKASIVDGPVFESGLTWWKLDIGGWCVEQVEDETILEAAPTSDFEKAIFFVFQQEGGYVNDPADPGGETRWGISKRSYPNVNVRDLPKEAARNIYYHDYWLRSGADQLPWPLNLFHLDASVNCGIGQSSIFLRESGGDCEAYNNLRRKFYTELHQFNLYGSAWMRRVDQLEIYAHG